MIARHRRARRHHQSRPTPLRNKFLVDNFHQNRNQCPTFPLQHQTSLLVSVMSLAQQAKTSEGTNHPFPCTLFSTMKFNIMVLTPLSSMTSHALLISQRKSTATAFRYKLDSLSTLSLNKRDTTRRSKAFDRVSSTPGLKTSPKKPNNRGSRATREQHSSRNAMLENLSRHCRSRNERSSLRSRQLISKPERSHSSQIERNTTICWLITHNSRTLSPSHQTSSSMTLEMLSPLPFLCSFTGFTHQLTAFANC